MRKKRSTPCFAGKRNGNAFSYLNLLLELSRRTGAGLHSQFLVTSKSKLLQSLQSTLSLVANKLSLEMKRLGQTHRFIEIEGGEALNLVESSKLVVGGGIDLGNVHLSIQLVGKLLPHGGEILAVSAPLSMSEFWRIPYGSVEFDKPTSGRRSGGHLSELLEVGVVQNDNLYEMSRRRKMDTRRGKAENKSNGKYTM